MSVSFEAKMRQIVRSDSEKNGSHPNTSRSHCQAQGSTRELFPLYKNEKKLKPDKIYRFLCGGFIDNGPDKICKKVEYKAEYDRPVEEFIYPSLQIEMKSETKKRGGGAGAGAGGGGEMGEKPYDSRNLKWRFKEEDIQPTEIPSRNSLVSKLEKGEKYLQENLKTKYHGRILAELKDKEDKLAQQSKTSSNLAQLTESVQYHRRENIVKSLGIFENNLSEKDMNCDDLVRTSSLFLL